jgi:hypothetical protein
MDLYSTSKFILTFIIKVLVESTGTPYAVTKHTPESETVIVFLLLFYF